MLFEITPVDEHGTRLRPTTVDIQALRRHLEEAAAASRRIHVRPVTTARPRPAGT